MRGTDRGVIPEALGDPGVSLDALFHEIPSGITVQDPNGRLSYANAAAARLLGYESPHALLSVDTASVANKFEVFDEKGDPLPLSSFPTRQALAGQNPPETVMRFRVKATGAERWSRVKSTPILDEQGKVRCVLNVFDDVTSAMRADLSREFLMKAGALLSASLDLEKTFSQIAELAVPRLADWCAVDLLSPDRRVLEYVAIAHKDPEKIRLANEFIKKYPSDLDAPNGVANVIRTGRSELVAAVTDEMLVQGAKDEEHLRMIRAIGFRSIMMVPLVARTKNLGAIVFVNSETTRAFDAEDLATAEELGRLAGLAVENARLYAQATRALAEKEDSLNALKTSEAELRLLAEAIPHMVWSALPDGSTAYFNRRWFEYTGLSEKESIEEGWLNALHPDDRFAAEQAWSSAVAEEKVYEIEYRVRRMDGEYRWHLGRGVPMRDEEGKVCKWMGTCTDIHDQKLAAEKMRRQAYYDPLTGLPNRALLEERIQEAIRRADASETQFALLFLDLDRFKVFNDSLGHQVGDAILQEVAERLSYCTLRKDDMVARLGGDEFVVLLHDLESAKDAVRIAKKILIVLEPAVKVDTHSFHVGTSIGIAFYPNDGADVHALLKNADLALYRAKEYGRNRYQMYDETMNQQATKRLGLENDLRDAIRNRELTIFYQPIIDIKANRIMELEALVRWQHPKFGFLQPGDFIALAEETGLIVPMGRLVMKTACREFKKWQLEGFNIPKLALNLSPLQFSNPQLVEEIETALKENGLAPSSLDLEITESTAMESIDRTSHKLKALKQMGVDITIDDFGTGYSSLSYLKRFPLNKLKIDRSFVRHAVLEEQDASIIRTIISIGHSLNLKVVAEGVETAKQLHLLSELGCDKVQGYFLSPPLSFADMTKWLKLRENRLFQTNG